MAKDAVNSEKELLKLSQSVIRGIQCLNDLQDNEAVQKIIEKSIRRAAESDHKGVAPETTQESTASLIEYALVSLVILSAKNNLTSNELRHIVSLHGAVEHTSGQIARVYEANLPELRYKLSTYGHTEPFAIDANWKMSCSIQSDSMNTHGELLYKISLEDVDSTSGRAKSIVNFTCNTEELQSLIAKLKDVERHCDKVGKQ